MALTKKQVHFCEEYISNGFNALAAYRKAFNKKPEDLVNKPSYPYTLLKKQEIIDYINERRDEIFKSQNIDAIRVAQELAEMAFALKGDEVYNAQIKLRALEALSKNLGLTTQNINTNETIEVTLIEED